MTVSKLTLACAALVFALGSTPSFAQSAAATGGPTTQGVTDPSMTKEGGPDQPRTHQRRNMPMFQMRGMSGSCSARATRQHLHGAARTRFLRHCMHAA